MKNPLNRRLTRELKGELGKYLVILILLIATIGFVSGFLVADGSMLTAYNESFEKPVYHLVKYYHLIEIYLWRQNHE